MKYQLIKVLYGAALAICGLSALAAPVADLSGGQTGRIEFDSITPPDRWQFVRKNLDNTKEATVFGDLLMPRKTSGKVPAVLVSHDSGGVTAKLYDVWAKELNNAGITIALLLRQFASSRVEPSRH